MVLLEDIVARVLTVSLRRRVSLREAAKELFANLKQYDFLKPPVRVLTLGVCRHFALIDRVLELHDFKATSLYQRNLARVVVFEVLLQARKQKWSRLKKAATRAGLSMTLVKEISKIDPSEIVKGLSGDRRLSVLYSVPEWLLKEFKTAEIPQLERFLNRIQQDPQLWIRVSTHLIRKGELIERLKRNRVEVVEDEHLFDVLKVLSFRGSLSKLLEFREGLFAVQDKASALVSHVAGGVKRFKVVDITGGPGLKATHMVQLGSLRAMILEISPRRAGEARELIRRLRMDEKVDIIACDSTRPSLSLSKFDVIIVDPPCSNLGRLCSNPELKLILRRSDIVSMSKLQEALLERAVKDAKEGAVIVYSVCTITLSETSHVLKRVLGKLDRVSLTEAEPLIGVPDRDVPGTQRLYPHIHETQGFYIAKLVRD